MKISRRIVMSSLVAAAWLATAAPSLAAPPVSQKNGYAIDGFDVVAYFTTQKPVKGQAAFSSTWRGATWLFASAENKAKFDATPEAYAPQYGGHCSLAMTEGKKSSGDPQAWRVYNGKLYLNGSPNVRDTWLFKIDQNIKNADWWWQKSYANL